jgi:hypothetical protein
LAGPVDSDLETGIGAPAVSREGRIVATTKRQTGKTIAKDSEGKEYTVVAVTTFIDAPRVGSARKEFAGSQEFFVSVEEDGIRVSKGVKRISQGEYEIIDSGVRLRSDAEDAP